MATYSTTSILSTALLKAVRDRHPEIQIFVNDNFGLVLSEMVMSGRMDMAIIYTPHAVTGVTLEPMLVEELFFLAPPGCELPPGCSETISLAAASEFDLLLPGPNHYLRRLVDGTFVRCGLAPRVMAEIESSTTLREAIEGGLGATILPRALVSGSLGSSPPLVRHLVEPTIETTVSLCTSDSRPLSDPARAVRDILRSLVQRLLESERGVGIRAP